MHTYADLYACLCTAEAILNEVYRKCGQNVPKQLKALSYSPSGITYTHAHVPQTHTHTRTHAHTHTHTHTYTCTHYTCKLLTHCRL